MPEIHHILRGPNDTILVVEVPRELNHDSAEPLRAAVQRSLPNCDGAAVVLDMTRVALISSIGIAALLQVQEFCRDRGVTLTLAAVPARQMGFLQMLKLDRKFAVAGNVDEAIARAG